MSQVCNQLSPFLFRVRHLGIYTIRYLIGQNDVGGEQWLGLVRSFRGARDFCVGDRLTTSILCALGLADRLHTTVLPALSYLRVENPMAINERSWGALHSFTTYRALSGHPVQHAYRMMCSYCTDFELTPGRNHQFLGHLESTHPKVVFRDGLINLPFRLDDLFSRHSSLRILESSYPPPRCRRLTPNS